MNKKRISKIILAAWFSAIFVTGCTGANAEPKQNQAQNGEQETDAEPNAAIGDSAWIGSKNTTRINTNDPVQAAVLVSQTLWMATSDMNRPGGVVLANPEDWQATVAGSDLIHFPNNGPVLFVNNNDVPEATQNELKRLNPTGVEDNNGTQVILVGNLGDNVENQVKELGFKTDKIAGDNPAAVAKAVDAYYTRVSQENPQSVIIGSMDSKEYTIPAMNWISHMPEPLLYVTKEEIPPDTVDALETRNGKANIYLLGPESVISKQVEQQLGQYGKVVRIAADNPYDSAIAFAKYKDPQTGFGWGLTTPGRNFSFVSSDTPELALAAAPFSHLGKHAPLLWTEKDKLPDSLMMYVMSVQPKYKASPTEGPYNHAWLIGGTDALATGAQGEIDAMLEIVSESGAGHGAMDMGRPENGEMSNMPGM